MNSQIGSDSSFRIPPDFVDCICSSSKDFDDRTDEDILELIAACPTAISSEKNVWAFWHSGLYNMPKWCQRNVVDWVRKLGPEWTVRVLDKVPSSSAYALNFVPAPMLPDSFANGEMAGPWLGQHSADMLRGACLYLYGGAWMDVGCLLFRHLDDLCWNKLQDPDTPYEVCAPHVRGQTIANNFVAARKGSRFILRWQELFTKVWQGRETAKGLSSHPLLKRSTPPAESTNGTKTSSKPDGFAFPFKVEPEVVLDYVAQILAWERVCLVKEDGKYGFDGPDYWNHRILTFPSIDEVFAADKMTQFNSQELFEMLSLPLPGDSNGNDNAQSELQKKAKEMVWHLIARSSMLKVYQGKSLLKTAALGELWSMPENDETDCKKGTFAELLRYGSTHFEQKREMPFIEQPPVENAMEGPLLG